MKRNEALEIVREYYPSSGKDLNEALETLIPELKESEDERIRKQLLNWFKNCHWDAIDKDTKPLKRDDIIAWLEKKKPTKWSENDETMLKNVIGAIKFLSSTNESWFYLEDSLEWLESLKNQ